MKNHADRGGCYPPRPNEKKTTKGHDHLRKGTGASFKAKVF